MDKEDVVHSYSGILLAIKRNRFGSVAVRWMDPEPILRSEISRKRKTNVIFNAYMWNLEKW